MDSGVLNLAWCQGYNGSPITYIEPDVLCYQCGRNVKTISTDGKHGTFALKGNAVGKMAVHNVNKHIAVGEFCQSPKIYVYAYPTYSEIAVLEGGAELEFRAIAFSESDYLVSVSGVPNFEMVLWNYIDGTKLTSVNLSPEPLTAVSFNKTNWRQICVMTDSAITMWNIEQCDSNFLLLPQKVKLPPVDPDSEDLAENHEDQDQARSSTKMSKYAVDIPESSVAGLVGEQTEQLEEIKDMAERVTPVSITWLPTGDFYIGCRGGQLFKVDSELNKTKILYYPKEDTGGNPFDRDLTSISRGETDMPPQDVSQLYLKPGSLQTIALHQRGLYAAGNDGIIRVLNVSGDEVSLQEEINVGLSITSLCFNSNYQKLAWGSPEGVIQNYNCVVPAKDAKIVTLAKFSCGDVMGVGGIAYGSECSVSLREDGLVQLWNTVTGTFVSKIHVQEPGETLACSRLAQYAAVGSKGGQLIFIDLSNPQTPRVVMRHRLFKSPIKHLVFNGDQGTLLFASSTDNKIFLIDARPTNNFAILGYVETTGSVQSMATYGKDTDTLLLAACNNNPDIVGSNLLYKFLFHDEVIKNIKYHYKSPMNDIKEESCGVLKMGLRHAICGLAIGEGEVVFALSAANKRLLSFALPLETEKKLKKIDLLLAPSGEYPGHMLPGGNLLLSNHLKWLLSFAPDGQVKIRTIGGLDRTAAFTPHDYHQGGVKAVAFSDNSEYILSCGYDGVVSCYQWHHAKSKSTSAKQLRERDKDVVEKENQKLSTMAEWGQGMPSVKRASQVERDRKDRIETAKQAAQEKDEIYVSPPPSPRANATWLEQREIDARRQENQHYSDVKRDIRTQIRDIRRTIQQMMGLNKDLPEIEKLGRHEFDLDLEEQNRLQAEGEAEIKKVREDIEYDNLAKLYLREKIKEECWDNMKVKGRALQAFNAALEVSNFPLRERTLESLNHIKTVSIRRQIEIREAKIRKELVEKSAKPASREDGDDMDEVIEDDGQEHPSISGSLGSQYGGANELFYNQFDLHTREQKVAQIVFLEDAIHRIKEAFNKEFNEVYAKKEQEISKVKDKNRRIAYIIKYLGLEENCEEPGMSVAEKPELLLEVAEAEIKVDKYLTPEQKAKQEEEKRLEEERLAKERGDNARDRALDQMMGGVLEIKKEDELKKDVPKPSFMLTKKEEDWVEDEQKQYKDYLKKVQELQEEREKYRKQLETELRKLQATILENLQNFDDSLNSLFMRKIKVMMVIYQEELKILRLRYAMLIQEEIEVRERDLNQSLNHKKNLKQYAFEAVAESRKNLDNFKNEYSNLEAEDRQMDKSFRRDFSDVSALMVDQLYKQFKRRPRIQKFKAVDGSKSLNPYSDRPSSSHQLTYQRNQVDNALDELDKVGYAPEGCETPVWERMCKLRRRKVDSETLLKQKSSAMADMNAFLSKRMEEDEGLKNDIEDLGHQLTKLKEDEQRFILNLEVQLLLKQGQIEVDAGPFIRDFRDSVLVHRSVVEDLNNTIKQLGESKIASMVESKDFRKGIIQLEWEHKKMSMQMEDLENKMKDIQFIKVTREIQAFLMEDDYDSKKAAEISTLEQTIALQKKHHEKNIDERKRILRDLSKNVKYKGSSNRGLDKDLLDLNVVVNERRHIEEVNADNKDDSGAEKRYQEIVQRRKLVDLAKAQAQEVAVLRAEVERLRMRTFPALVQVER